jgi:hypothetical protein
VNILDHILPARRRRIREVREVLLEETARHKRARHLLLADKVHGMLARGEHHFIVRDYIMGRLSYDTAQKILNGEIK